MAEEGKQSDALREWMRSLAGRDANAWRAVAEAAGSWSGTRLLSWVEAGLIDLPSRPRLEAVAALLGLENGALLEEVCDRLLRELESPSLQRRQRARGSGRDAGKIPKQPDIDYLNAQLRRAVPLANITAIPNGTNSVILTGFVSRADDIAVANAVAQSVVFTPIISLRVVQPSRFGQTISDAPGTANLFSGIVGPNSGFLAFLEALEQENLAKLLAQPRLVTLSGNPASFLDGGEQAVPVPTGLGQVGVQFEEFGTRLNFLPIVLGNGRIHLEVKLEVSSPDAERTTQRVHRTAEIENGQTLVLGGPRLDRGTGDEVLVLVTPRILLDPVTSEPMGKLEARIRELEQQSREAVVEALARLATWAFKPAARVQGSGQ